MASAGGDSGVPPYNEFFIEDASNIDPNIQSPWDRKPLNVSPEKVEKLFTVTITGDFDTDRPPHEKDPREKMLVWIAIVKQTKTNRWDIKHTQGPSSTISISFTMNRYVGYSTLNTTMRLYKAAVELERLLLVNLLPFATGPFDIQVQAMERAKFDTHYNDTSADSRNKFTREWLNKHTAGRVYDWITTIVPMFTRSWMPDDKIRTLIDGYNTGRGQHQSAEDALRTSNENLIFVVFTRTGDHSVTIVGKKHFLEIDTIETRRFPCKVQSTAIFADNDKLLGNTVVIDLQLGFTRQVLVRKSLLSSAIRRTRLGFGRVFCVFPSFDKFPGLWSSLAHNNVVSALHCNPDEDMDNPTTFFTTSGLVQSGGQSLHKIQVDSCKPGGEVFRIRKGDRCVTPYKKKETHGRVDGEMCCELHPRKDKNAQVWDEMRIFGNRTRDPQYQQSSLIQDAFKWFFEEFGIDGPISINTDFRENEYDDMSEIYEMNTLDAFKAYMPNCSELRFRFKTEDGLDKAIECMTEASKAKVVHNVTFFVSMTLPHPPMKIPDPFPPHPDTKTLEMAEIPPQNKTHIVFTEKNHPPRRVVFMRLEMWIQKVENRQVDISFQSLPVYDTDEDGRRLEELWYHTHEGVVGVFTTRQYTTTSSRIDMHFMRRNHVEVTIDTSKFGETYETVVRFRAGTKHDKVPLAETNKRKGKGKAEGSGGSKRGRSEIDI